MVLEIGKKEVEKAVLVGLARNSREKQEVETSLDELGRLVWSAGAVVRDRRIQVRNHPDPATFIGRGMVEELKQRLVEIEANSVIFDDTLSPAQQRNLENALQAKVIDRPILILDIFATRARSRAARLQVELAQLEYTLPRLTGAWVHFSRQYGGIGSKGPGETQLEIDRRQVRTKISHLKKRLEKLDQQRHSQRKGRHEFFKVALVGYTNAGKSTLFNRLTKASVGTADMLFTTLDSTTRTMSTGFPVKVMISDTVGFIRKLPHQLVESFKSTLEEVSLADLLLQVVDASAEDLDQRILHTRQVLTEISAHKVPYLLVFNKIDACPEFLPSAIVDAPFVTISAAEGTGVAHLQEELITRCREFQSQKNGF
ncbi:MAG TPA: GTPase HflX [candidate division Zixibacteria bacterium]|mgnify:CR=1 FL=1|nr:GTPase HflX [candidate division Zixibacteria bacterium]